MCEHKRVMPTACVYAGEPGKVGVAFSLRCADCGVRFVFVQASARDDDRVMACEILPEDVAVATQGATQPAPKMVC